MSKVHIVIEKVALRPSPLHSIWRGSQARQVSYSAYVLELPGCVATGATPDEVRRNIGEAIELHVEGMKEDGIEIPESLTVSETEVSTS